MAEAIQIKVEPSDDDGKNWNVQCPIVTCGRDVSAWEDSKGVINVDTAGCTHFADFDWYEDTFKFNRPSSGPGAVIMCMRLTKPGASVGMFEFKEIRIDPRQNTLDGFAAGWE